MDKTAQPRGTGRPKATSHRELARVALALFIKQGFDETSVDDIAAAVGVNRRTFFRYFPTKAATLFDTLDEEIAVLRQQLASADPLERMISAIHKAVVATNANRDFDEQEFRERMTLVNSVRSLQGARAAQYAGWLRAISDFVALRTGMPGDSLLPITVARAVLAATLAAYDMWISRSEDSLVAYLDEALGALADGFDEDAMTARAARSPLARRRSAGD